MKTQMLPTGNEKGFTLIEILIAVVLLGIALSIVTPALGKFMKSVEIKGSQRKIVKLLKEAHNSAVKNNRPEVVKIKSSKLYYQDPVDKGEKIVIHLDSVNLKITSNIDKIVFYPDGTSSGGKLTIIYNNQERHNLIIDKITGEPEWSEARE